MKRTLQNLTTVNLCCFLCVLFNTDGQQVVNAITNAGAHAMLDAYNYGR